MYECAKDECVHEAGVWEGHSERRREGIGVAVEILSDPAYDRHDTMMSSFSCDKTSIPVPTHKHIHRT